MSIMTQKGYHYQECMSALQKAIQRSDEPVAMYFMVELFNSGFEDHVWRKLKLVCSEDVGLATPSAPATIKALHESFTDQRAHKLDHRPERVFLVHAVTYLVRCEKSRLCAWFEIKLWREHEHSQMVVPSYAFDMHTYQGRKSGRSVDHYFGEGTALKYHKPAAREDKVREEAMQAYRNKPGRLKFDISQNNQMQVSLFDEASEDAK